MTEENTTPEAETEAPAPMDPVIDPNQLTVADLKMMARIIQVGSQRGSFKAEELGTVGGLYNKIIAFLGAAGQLDPMPEEAPETPSAEMMPEETDGSTPSDEVIEQ